VILVNLDAVDLLIAPNFIAVICCSRSRDSSVDPIATGYALDGLGSISGRRKSFLYSTVSTGAQGPTQPPIQRVPGIFPPGVKRKAYEADHSPPSVAEVQSGGVNLHSPTRLHGVVLN
jgi:hypothetical protein